MQENCLAKLSHLVKSKKKLSKHLESHGGILSDVDKINRIVKEIKEASGDSKEGKALRVEDFRDAESKGRWWKLGEAYNKEGLSGSGGSHDKEKKAALGAAGSCNRSGNYDDDDRIAKLAAKMKMNTPFKKKLFRILLTSFDAVEFCNSLNSLNLATADLRTTVRIVVDVCGQEKKYNKVSASSSHLCALQILFEGTYFFRANPYIILISPAKFARRSRKKYYEDILTQLLEGNKREHKMTLNLAYKDAVKDTSDNVKRARNLGTLAAKLIGLQGIDFVYAFSDVEFDKLSQSLVVFFVYLFGTMFADLSPIEVEAFAKLLNSKDAATAMEVKRFLRTFLESWKANKKGSMWRQNFKLALKNLGVAEEA